MHHHLAIVISAFFLEAAFGYPQWLYKRVRHPVVWIGAGITLLEKKFNRSEWSDRLRRILGVLAMAILLIIIIVIVMPFRFTVIEVLCIASLLATRSLYDHVYDVYIAITSEGIEAARTNVGRVVGRDVANLNESGVCRAAIESLAESFSDGVVAPLFWAVCFGLPGIACYKAINTADSMIGHKDERYRAFGWAAARLDDVANFIPARLSGLLIALAAYSANALRCMRVYARGHASPNAGWPEAAMAGALGVQLGGVNNYDGIEHKTAAIGDGTTGITSQHLQKALSVYVNACILLWFILLLALLVP